MDSTNVRNGSIFDGVSDTYHVARPRYPEQLVDDLIKGANLSTGSRILEIGVGTGKLTESLAKRGLKITGIELGNNLAAIARNNFSNFRRVEIIVGDFDNYAFTPDSFDAVIAATSFHWLDPATRANRIAEILKVDGVAAIVDTRHVDAGIDGFPIASQKCYREWNSNTPANYRLPSPEDVVREGFRRKAEFMEKFSQLMDKPYFQIVEYSSEMYLQLLTTYSDVIAMDEPDRNGLLKCMGDLIDKEFDGKITKNYLWQLFLAKKKKV